MREAFVAVALLAAGCAEPATQEPQGFTSLAVRLDNQGASAIPVDVTVTGPDGVVILSRSVLARPGAVVEERVDTTLPGRYHVQADFSHEERSGNNVQRVDADQRHILATSDCATEAAAVVFSFRYTSTSTTQSFANLGSRGVCIEAGTSAA